MDAETTNAQQPPAPPDTSGGDGSDFAIWWHNEGSGMPPMHGEDAEAHVRRICAIAWSNGADKQFEPLRSLRNEVNCRIEHGAESNGHLPYVQDRLDAIINPNNMLCVKTSHNKKENHEHEIRTPG